jgi:hypothetical protein
MTATVRVTRLQFATLSNRPVAQQNFGTLGVGGGLQAPARQNLNG